MIDPLLGEIEEARKNPNGWVYRISGHFADDQAVPPEAIVGAWKVDEFGCIEGEFVKNPNYNAMKYPMPGS